MDKEIENKKLNGKDLINIGIFGAIYFVITFFCAMLGMIPVFVILIGILVPLIAGAPIMLFLTRVKAYGMIFILSLIMGTLMLITGMGIYPIMVSLVTGVIAEYVFKAGKYNSPKRSILTYAVFSLWCWGNYILMFTNRRAYFASRTSFGKEYMNTLTSLTPMWLLFVLLPLVFLSGLAGGMIGQKLILKHFKKAGIA